MSDTIVQVHNVVKHYSKAPAPSVDQVQFHIDKGAIFGVFGPNGAGKTTLISMLCGLLQVDQGSVSYHFNSHIFTPKQAQPHIGFVPQDFSFYPELSAQQNLAFFGAQYGLDKEVIIERSDQLLERVGLTGVKNKKVSSFSGGMKRRLNLIIGIMHQPAVLFLDEPTVGVDVQSKIAIMELLKELNEQGTTILYTSHHLKEAEDFCSTMVLLDHGKIIANNTLPELLAEHSVANLEELLLKLTGNALRD